MWITQLNIMFQHWRQHFTAHNFNWNKLWHVTKYSHVMEQTCEGSLVSLDYVFYFHLHALLHLWPYIYYWHCKAFVLDEDLFHIHEHFHITVHSRRWLKWHTKYNLFNSVTHRNTFFANKNVFATYLKIKPSPSLITLKFINCSQNVAQGTTRFEI